MNDKLKRLIEKWRKFSASLESCFPDSCGAITRRCADELEAALSADPQPQLTDGDIKELLAMAWTLFNEPLPTARRKMMAYMEEIGYTRIAEAQPEAPTPSEPPCCPNCGCAQVNALRDALRKLPLESFGDDMEKCDAADFVDHAGQFFEAMLAARAALQPSPLSAKDSK